MSSELGPSVALLGIFDAADYGELLTARILERELRMRLPLARVDQYAPLGQGHPIALDGGRPALPLGPPDASRKSQLAEQHDFVVITGNVIHTRDDLYAQLYRIPAREADRLQPSGFFVDGLGPELEHRCPVAWHAVAVPFDLDPTEAQRVKNALSSRRHVSVRDRVSRERLLAIGSASDIAVVPDATVLAKRLFRTEVLRKRLDYLRVMDWYPVERPPVVVQGDASIADRASEIAHEVGALNAPIVLAELTGWRGDDLFADTIAPLLPDPPFRLPTQLTLEDITAAIAHARAFVGTSPAGHSTALAFGVPSTAPTEGLALALRATAGESLVAELQDGMDSEFDELAALAERAWSARSTSEARTAAELLRALSQAEERYQALLRAYEERGERLVQERLRYAEIVEALEAASEGLSAETVSRGAELENQLEIALAAEAEARFELERLRAEWRRQADA